MTPQDACAALAGYGIMVEPHHLYEARDAISRWVDEPMRGEVLAVIDATEPAPDSAPREVLELRASGMPMAFACPGSARRPAIRIRETSEPANLGTAAHEALRPLAEVGVAAWDSVPALSSEYECDPDELRMLVACGTKLWKQIEASFPNSVTEVDMGARGLSGHADVLSISGNVARGLDWKSGRKDSDYSEQMRAYCALVLDTYPAVDEVTFTLGWLRDQTVETYTMRREDAATWWAKLDRVVVRWDGIYHPGSQCGYCPRAHECEARSALVRRSIADVLGSDPGAALATMEPSAIFELFEKVSIIADVAKKVREAIRERVVEGGDVVANDHRLTIATENRRKLVTIPAFETLSAAGFGDAEWAECVEIKLSKCEAIAKAKAPYRGGAKAIKELQEKLEAADAIRTYEIKKLVTRRG